MEIVKYLCEFFFTNFWHFLGLIGNCRFCQQRMRQMMWEVQDSILNTMD